MRWHLYLLTFRLKSPIHIGFHKVMHLSRTRAYVPARPFWGSLTAKLAGCLKSRDYREIGDFLKKAMRFGYLYLSDGNNLFIPKYTHEGLKFGKLSRIEFEKRFIGSLTSTSIEPWSFTAEEGMLHEVEFISPYEMHGENEEPKPVFLKGLLWVSEKLEGKLKIQIDENDFSIGYEENNVKFSVLASELQVGGERKYGFGKIRLEKDKFEEIHDQDLNNLGFNGKWRKEEDNVVLELKKDEFIWSHAKYNPDLRIRGSIEPIVGRDWSNRGAGRELKFYDLCWAPGSIITEDKIFKITEDFGLWEMMK